MHIQGLCKRFFSSGSGVEVFQDFSMQLPDQEITAVLGPSGCGKTTLLNILAGFVVPDSGSIEGMPGTISYLFQEPRLLPWRTVERNISIVLEHHIADAARRRESVDHYLALVGLQEFAQAYPHELSGGMRQRASIARAFACPSRMLLMDEPFQALDLDLKISLVEAFTSLWEEDPKTAVFVTHDIQEALLVADSVAVFSKAPARELTRIPVPGRRKQRSLTDSALTAAEQEIVSVLLGR